MRLHRAVFFCFGNRSFPIGKREDTRRFVVFGPFHVVELKWWLRDPPTFLGERQLPEFVYLDKRWPCVRNTWKDDIEKMLGHVFILAIRDIWD